MPSVNHFGPGVIGKEAAEANAKDEETGANIFGPGILEHRADAKERPMTRLGDRIPAPDSEEAELLANDKKDDPPPAFTALSIPLLEKELKVNPARFDELYRGEFLRPEGARKGALGIFLSHEQTHADRKEVVEALVDMLKAKEAAS